ncbi:MAG: D-xylose 1-dehydrogenase Gfo6 [Halobacteriales archaeon]|nr:D-xylose 1-dehydrogenase Gfo6 [Halobacteriales archaeon]
MEFPADFERFDERDWDTGPDGTVRLAVVGVGGFARRVVLPAIADADYCEPTVLISGSPSTGELAAEQGCELLDYEAYAAGDLADAYDAVYVATPNALHLPHAETAAALGKPVICEKPLEATVERAERLVAACEDAGVTLMTAYRMQTDPVVRRLRAFLADEGIGRITHLHGDFTYPVLGGSRGPDQWRLDPELAGGGALADVGVYPLNTARYLLGADPVSASGVTAGDGPFAGVDETVAFLVEFPDGVHGAFTASFTGPTDTRLAVSGSEGRVELVDAFQPRTDRTLRIETAAGAATFEGLGADEVREEFDYFAHCVLTDTTPEPDGGDGLTDVRTMAEVYRDAGLDVPMAG